MQFPEHTRESYVAAARQGAGVLECDVVFTKDAELVCRHAQDDLATHDQHPRDRPGPVLHRALYPGDVQRRMGR